MKKLLYLVALAFHLTASAQLFPVKNVNDEYVIMTLKGSENFRNNIKEVLRDENGLYWFQNMTNISSFDGVNWKSYQFTNANGRNVPVRINEIEVTDDSTIWLATAEGLYGFNRTAEKFIPIKQMYPHLKEMPSITNCIYKGIHDFLFVSFVREGFFVFKWKSGEVKHVCIDSINNVTVPTDRKELDVTTDNAGNYWGLTTSNKGIWRYNSVTGKISCSWKGEIFPGLTKRLQGRNISGIVYSEKDNSLWMSYGSEGILEKMYLSTGTSVFYSFSDDLNARADTNSKKRHSIMTVKIDGEGNEWLLVAGKYLVKLNADIAKFEYLAHDQDLLPLGKMDWLLPDIKIKTESNDNDENLLWLVGDRGLSVLNKRNDLVKQIPFEKVSADGITPDDYTNGDLLKGTPFRNIFLTGDLDGNCLLLQSNPGRPKLLRFGKDLRITHALLNNKWKEYPAYFNPVIRSENFYIAILRPEIEPLDFRNVVIKDFKVDLRTMKVDEVSLAFSQRVWRYGAPDAANVFWLFSNGYLYSYDPQKDRLDSIFICEPRAKASYPNRIKSFDFPTVLHKNTSTFWISFIANKELYKIDLKKRKIDRVFKSCLDQNGCLQSSVFQLYNFDSSRIYLKLNMSAALLNPANDSVTIYSDLFENELPYEDHVGALVYKDWICSVTSSEVNLQNTVSGKQKRLSLNEHFKGNLSALSYPPLVNDAGEIIVMSSAHRGFVVFSLNAVPAPVRPGFVRFSSVRIDANNLPLDSLTKVGSLRLKYNAYGNIHFRFSEYSLIDQDKIKYEYTLYNGGDTVWNKTEGSPELTLTRISPGDYKLLIRATNGFGDYSPKITSFSISIIPLFTQTTWFIVLLIVIVAAILYALYRYRLHQVKRFQTIRNNIASDLHDDIGSTLNSISIYSEVAKQQAGQNIPALEMIGNSSRKVIESMSDIVWTINPENDSFEKIIVRMRSFAHQLLNARKVEYTFEVDEKLNSVTLPMLVRKNFYLVFKEGITNLVKYSGASRVAISLKEENGFVVLKIRDNGIGIPVNSETQGNGLMNMRRRAREINASLDIFSANGEGTGIELMLKT
jgi:two-component sensor histidine kinase